MNLTIAKILLILLLPVLIVGYNKFSQNYYSQKNTNEVGKYLEDIGEFTENGNIQIVKAEAYKGKIELENNQRAIFLQIRVIPEDAVIDIDDIELHSKSGEFLGYANWFSCLDKNQKEIECEEDANPYYFGITFKVPQDFIEGEIKYSRRSFGTFYLQKVPITPSPTTKAFSSKTTTLSAASPSTAPAKAPLSSMKVHLVRTSSAVPEQAKGEVDIQVTDKSTHYSNNPDYSILSFKFDIRLSNLESEKDYLVYLCQINEGDCNGIATVKTDKSGSLSYSSGLGITYNKNSPIRYIKVVHPGNSGACSLAYSPCLKGDYNLIID